MAMDVIPRLAVVCTHNRPAELARLIDAVAPQCHYIMIIDNASDPPVPRFEIADWPAGVSGEPMSCWIKVVHDDEQPPNLSRLWNVGLQMAANLFRNGAYDVAVLNDDAVPPPGWWDAVSGAMRSHGAAAASSDPLDSLPPHGSTIWYSDAPMSVMTRLTGWAFMLRGELGMRADERLRWWAGDDDISLRARRLGGVVHVGGFPVPNTGANSSTTGPLAEQAGRDMEMFVQIHGIRPW